MRIYIYECGFLVVTLNDFVVEVERCIVLPFDFVKRVIIGVYVYIIYTYEQKKADAIIKFDSNII